MKEMPEEKMEKKGNKYAQAMEEKMECAECKKNKMAGDKYCKECGMKLH